MLIEQSTSAAKVILKVRQKHIGSALRVVGTIVNDIAIEYPLVISPDVDNDAHWSALVMEENAIILNDSNIMWVINGTLGPIRINKPAGDNVGVANVW